MNKIINYLIYRNRTGFHLISKDDLAELRRIVELRYHYIDKYCFLMNDYHIWINLLVCSCHDNRYLCEINNKCDLPVNINYCAIDKYMDDYVIMTANYLTAVNSSAIIKQKDQFYILPEKCEHLLNDALIDKINDLKMKIESCKLLESD